MMMILLSSLYTMKLWAVMTFQKQMLRGWFQVDLDFLFLQKEYSCQNHQTLAPFKIFSLYTNTFLASSWQVTGVSSVKGFILTA
jgi:hypothetical protein